MPPIAVVGRQRAPPQAAIPLAALPRRHVAAALALVALLPMARAQLPNLRVGLPADEDQNKRLDVQPGYSLRVRAFFCLFLNRRLLWGSSRRRGRRRQRASVVAAAATQDTPLSTHKNKTRSTTCPLASATRSACATTTCPTSRCSTATSRRARSRAATRSTPTGRPTPRCTPTGSRSWASTAGAARTCASRSGPRTTRTTSCSR